MQSSQIVHRITASGLAMDNTIHGCRHEEISELEAVLAMPLPQAYKEFLYACGKGAGEFLVGTDWTIATLPRTQALALKLFKKCTGASLPATAFVFAMHQGYQFLFFECQISDDPAVYLYVEGEDIPKRVFPSFSDWLTQCIQDEATAH